MQAPFPHENAEYARTVLVVEDEPLLCDLIVTALEERGFAAVGAASAVEAKRIFRAMDPDGIVMDIDLGPGPGRDGGRIVFEGTPADLVADRSTLTGEHLADYVGP